MMGRKGIEEDSIKGGIFNPKFGILVQNVVDLMLGFLESFYIGNDIIWIGAMSLRHREYSQFLTVT